MNLQNKIQEMLEAMRKLPDEIMIKAYNHIPTLRNLGHIDEFKPGFIRQILKNEPHLFFDESIELFQFLESQLQEEEELTSEKLINLCNKELENLAHKNFDRRSFFNGFMSAFGRLYQKEYVVTKPFKLPKEELNPLMKQSQKAAKEYAEWGGLDEEG